MPLDSSKTGLEATQGDLAKELGISERRVRKMVKLGMPTDSVEAAKRWRTNNQPRGVRKPVLKSLNKPAVIPPLDEIAPPKPIPDMDDETLVQYLTRVRHLEKLVYDDLIKAVKTEPDAVLKLQQQHANACRARNEVEEAMIDVQAKRGTLMNKQEALTVLTETIGAILLQTDSIPKLYNQKFPGLDPAVVEPILQTISDDVRRKTEAWIRQNKLNQ